MGPHPLALASLAQDPAPHLHGGGEREQKKAKLEARSPHTGSPRPGQRAASVRPCRVAPEAGRGSAAIHTHWQGSPGSGKWTASF